MKVHPIIFFCAIAVAIVVVIAIFPRPWKDRSAPTTFAQEEILGEVEGRASGEKWAAQQRGIPSGSQLNRIADDGAPNPESEAWKRGFKRGFESGYKKADNGGAEPAFK